MAQLSNDCFAGAAPSLTVEEAIALFSERLPVLAAMETVPLAEADGRIAAETCFARNDLPPFANSAVDGYAVRHADLEAEGETVLRVAGRLAAGSDETASAEGVAVRIFTGAAMPASADTVFMQEDVRTDGDRVFLPAGLKRGSNARPAGEDVPKGALIIPAGRRLRPQDIALASACGLTEIAVRKPLRVAIFSTGNELTEPGAPLGPGAIYDSNRIMMAALLKRLGAEVRDFGILRDDPETLGRRLAAAADGSDLILSSGGVSLGEEDHVKTAVEAVGQLVFWKLAIKPGRPLAMGMIEGTPFMGLPGNPAAVYVTFNFLVRPLLFHIGGALPEPLVPQSVRAAFSSKKKAQRREFVRVSVSQAADGILEARRFPKEGAALLTSLTTSDGLAAIGDDITAVSPGDMIAFYPHDLFW